MKKRRWLMAAQTLLGIVLLVAWLWIVDLGEVAEVLAQAQWKYIVVAGGLGVLSTLVRALRWRRVLIPIASVPRLDIWLIGLASGLINFVIPIRSGEFARSLFLRQRDSVPISASLPTVAVDRSLDLLAVLIIGAAGILGGLRLQGSLSLVLILGGGLFLGFVSFVVLAVFWQERLMRVAQFVIPNFIPDQSRARILRILGGIMTGFTAIGRQPTVLIPLTAMSFVAALLDAGVLFLLFVGVGNPVAPLIVLTGYAIFAITFIVPGAPGYIGSMEAFGSLIFAGAFGVSQASAASVVLIYHALSALILGIGGGIAIWALGFRPSSAFRSVVDAQSMAGIPSSSPQPSAEG